MHVTGVPISDCEPQDVATAAPAEVESITVAASASVVERANGNSTAFGHCEDSLLELLASPFGQYAGKFYFEGELNKIKIFLAK